MSIQNTIFIYIFTYIEFIISFLICILIYHYLFSINIKLHNDNFPIEYYSIFLSFLLIFITYLFFKDIELLYHTNRIFSIESNNLLIKLFLLYNFVFYVYYDQPINYYLILKQLINY